MKRLLKILILAVLIFAFADVKGVDLTWVNMITGICFFLTLCVLGGAFYYLVKVKKVKLFVISFLICSLFALPSFAQLDLSDIKAADQSGFRLTDLGGSVCEAERKGKLDLKALKKAQAIVDYWNKKGQIPSIIGGGDKNYECARSYIKYAAALGVASQATCSSANMLLKTAAEKDKCWPCDVTATILHGIQKMANKSYNAINNAAKITLGIGYLFWLTVTILVSFAKFGFEKFAEFFTKLLNKTLVVMIIALILHAPLAQFYRVTLSPFISFTAALSMELSEKTIAINKDKGSMFDKVISLIGMANVSKCSYCDNMKKNDATSGNFLTSSAINSILCLTCSTYKQTAPMIAIGQNLVCIGRSTPTPVINDIPVLNTVSSFIGPNPQVALFGLVLVMVFSVFTLLVGYFIMTSVLKLGIVLVLMPFFIVAYAFKTTRIYANNAWKLVVASMVQILIISVSVSFITIGFSSLMPSASAVNFVNFFLNSNGMDFANFMSGSNPLGDLTLNAESIEKLAGMGANAEASFSLLSILAFTYIGIHIISGSPAITDQLVSTWQLNSTEGQILSATLIDATKKGIGSAQSIWKGTKLGVGYMGDKITGIQNGQKVQTTSQAEIDKAVKVLNQSEGNQHVHAPSKYTYDEKS